MGGLPESEPGPGEVRIQVAATSLNHLDLWCRRGLPFPIPLPHVGGSDVAGRVERLGPGVEGVELGGRVVVDPSLDFEWYARRGSGTGAVDPRFQVLGEHRWGGLAELAVVPAKNLVRVPDEVPLETAAAAGLVTVTAYRALFTRGALRVGERVIITGGSGGVSTAAIQLARHAGARVYALTSGAKNVRRVEALGAHVGLDRTHGEVGQTLKEALGPGGADLVLDSVGAGLWPLLVKALRPGGRLVTYGATTGPAAEMDLRHVFRKQLSILGTTMGDPGEFRNAMALVFAGVVTPPIHEVLPLDATRRAHELLEAGGVFGKLVITP